MIHAFTISRSPTATRPRPQTRLWVAQRAKTPRRYPHHILLCLLLSLMFPAALLAQAPAAEVLRETPPPIPWYYRMLIPEPVEGGLDWAVLEQVSVIYTQHGEQIEHRVEFSEAVMQHHRRRVILRGYMLPLNAPEAESAIRHFLLSALPAHCPFCMPAGPARLVEVETDLPMAYTDQALAIEGRFHALTADALGTFYRLTDARRWP